MLKSATGMPTDSRLARGFTLIEILIVIVIFGVTITMAVMAYGDFGRSRKLDMEAEHLANKIDLLQYQAVLGAITYGIGIELNEYKFYRLEPPARWVEMKEQPYFEAAHFKDLQFRLVHPKSNHKHHGSPDIIIHSSGDRSPYEIEIRAKGVSQPVNIKHEKIS